MERFFDILINESPALGVLLSLLIMAIVALWARDISHMKKVEKARDKVEHTQEAYLGKLREVEVHLRSGAADRDKQLIAWGKIDDIHDTLFKNK